MTGVAFFDIDSFQLEEGVVATEYERPAPSLDYIKIHSLNDFDVVSQKSEGGRNLLLNTNREHGPGTREYMSLPYDLTPIFEEHGLDQEYTMSFDLKSKDISNYDTVRIYPNPGATDPNRHGFPQRSFKVTTEYQRFSMTFKPTDGNEEKTTTYISVYGQYDTGNFPMLRNIKVEKGNKATDWTPAPEDITESDNHPLIDKISLSLNEPLRSLGDVHDRLFRDSDGLWKVEQNVEVTGTEDGTQSIADAYSPYDVPVIEVLSNEYQNKLSNLRSFQGSNYVYTVINDKIDTLPTVAENLKSTLHARFLPADWYKEDKVINNLMIYSRALSDEEMLQNYKTIKRRWGM